MKPFLYPWKLFTLFVGTILMIVGGAHYEFSDWDAGVSVVMAFLTYLTAPPVDQNLMVP